MGNPNENIKAAQDFYNDMRREIDRSHKTGGILAAVLLGGMVITVIAAVALLVIAVV
jgi:hypothetical protein